MARTHYEIMGIPIDSDLTLIRAVYKALVRLYHPDVFLGDKKFAEVRLQEINLAYSTLSDLGKRADYDKNLNENESASSAEEMSEEFNDSFNAYEEMVSVDWSIAAQFYPEAEAHRKNLALLNPGLAFVYQSYLLDTKYFKDASKISLRLRTEFLLRKFGQDKNLHELVVAAIQTGNRQFAIDLNKAFVVVGPNGSDRVLAKLAEKYPAFANEQYARYGFGESFRGALSFGLKPGIYTTSNGGEFWVEKDYRAYKYVKIGMFSSTSVEYQSVYDMVGQKAFSEAEVKSAVYVRPIEVPGGMWS